jgi:hypothetical protein
MRAVIHVRPMSLEELWEAPEVPFRKKTAERFKVKV